MSGTSSIRVTTPKTISWGSKWPWSWTTKMIWTPMRRNSKLNMRSHNPANPTRKFACSFMFAWFYWLLSCSSIGFCPWLCTLSSEKPSKRIPVRVIAGLKRLVARVSAFIKTNVWMWAHSTTNMLIRSIRLKLHPWIRSFLNVLKNRWLVS